ncbi:hypothetical protein RP20_CCG026398 [Aedes albopictus]|nr:hypothetical protein RP20_CCG026398 [Aedes albopictus]
MWSAEAKQFNLYTSVESDLQQKLNTSEESIHVTLCVNIDTRFTLDATTNERTNDGEHFDVICLCISMHASSGYVDYVCDGSSQAEAAPLRVISGGTNERNGRTNANASRAGSCHQ